MKVIVAVAVVALAELAPGAALLAQDPPGTVAARARSAVIRRMPYVVGLTVDSARAVLEPLGVRPRFVTLQRIGVSTGVVTSQYPDSGQPLRPDSTVLRTGRVRIPLEVLTNPAVVAQPPTQVQMTKVPDLAPVDSSRWAEALKVAGLNLGSRSFETSVERPAGSAIRTDPEAGRDVPVRTPVAVVVSLGTPAPPPEQGRKDTLPIPAESLRFDTTRVDTASATPVVVRTLMPPVIGLTSAQAFTVLDSAGFTDVSLTGSTEAGSLVEAQQPLANDSAVLGAPVTLAMVAPQRRLVPGLVGLADGSARAVAGSLGFTVQPRTTRYAWRLTTVVDSQSPAPGPLAGAQPNVIDVWFVAPYAPPLVVFSTMLAMGVALGIGLRPNGGGRGDRDTELPPAQVTARVLPGASLTTSVERDGEGLVQASISVRFSTALDAPAVESAEESILQVARWQDEQ